MVLSLAFPVGVRPVMAFIYAPITCLKRAVFVLSVHNPSVHWQLACLPP